MPNKKILIAEDSLGLVKPLTIILKQANYLVESIIDGHLVLEGTIKSLPDLLLLDVSMPGADGREICEAIKKSSLKHIPIILMSAHNGIKDMSQKAGADDFISKPFNIPELLHKIEKHTSKK